MTTFLFAFPVACVAGSLLFCGSQVVVVTVFAVCDWAAGGGRPKKRVQSALQATPPAPTATEYNAVMQATTPARIQRANCSCDCRVSVCECVCDARSQGVRVLPEQPSPKFSCYVDAPPRIVDCRLGSTAPTTDQEPRALSSEHTTNQTGGEDVCACCVERLTADVILTIGVCVARLRRHRQESLRVFAHP